VTTEPGGGAGRAGPAPLWTPSAERVERATMTRFLRWLAEHRGLRLAGYDQAWRWSVEDLDGFWSAVWEFFEVGGPAPSPALAERRMPGARWFPDARLNHAELSLRRRDQHPALLFANEAGELGTVTYAELAALVAAAAAGLRRLGVAKGDRVVAYLPNVPETVVAMLATASIGAIWSSCAPEFGVSSVVDRFAQVEPKVLVAVDGYRYGGTWHDRRSALAEIRRRLPTLQATVLVGPGVRGAQGAEGGSPPVNQ
jgi:acetoacetyl-CoA synthetase